MNFKNLTMRKLAQMNLLLLALASCSVFDLPCTRACCSEQQITYARESAWIILGETTQNDIRTVLGEPTQKVKSSQGNDSWLYLWETEPYLVEMDEEGTLKLFFSKLAFLDFCKSATKEISPSILRCPTKTKSFTVLPGL